MSFPIKNIWCSMILNSMTPCLHDFPIGKTSNFLCFFLVSYGFPMVFQLFLWFSYGFPNHWDVPSQHHPMTPAADRCLQQLHGASPGQPQRAQHRVQDLHAWRGTPEAPSAPSAPVWNGRGWWFQVGQPTGQFLCYMIKNVMCFGIEIRWVTWLIQLFPTHSEMFW